MRLIALTLVMSLGVTVRASAQRAPMCVSRYDMSDSVERIFDSFVNDDMTDYRASIGIVTQSPSAPRGLLRDNTACAGLRAAGRKYTFVTDLLQF